MTNVQLFISLSVVIAVTFIWFGCSLALIEKKLKDIDENLKLINFQLLRIRNKGDLNE